jgi:hypothetical protein
MYDCVTGVQIPDNFGCIMADEMVSFFFQIRPLSKNLDLINTKNFSALGSR